MNILIKPTIKSEILPILLIIGSFIAAFYLYSAFPDQVPVHWNMAGEADDWGSKGFAAFFFPPLILAVYLMMLLLPNLDPKKDRYSQFLRPYHVIKNYIIFFFVLMYAVSSLVGLGYSINVSIVIPVAIGILFMIIGNYLGKIKSNWFIGIRTPWTLSSEETWNKTHRFASRVFILCGILMALIGFLPLAYRLPIFFIMIALMLIGTIGYSYIVYAAEQKKKR